MFKSQYNQDKYCYDKFLNQLPTPGVFVEVGAGNGIKHSNTYFYEKSLGWSGLCIEPRPKAFQQLVQNRDCFCEQVGIAREFNECVEFISIEGWGEGLSGIVSKYNPHHRHIVENIHNHTLNRGKETITIRTCPLQFLLDQYAIHHINFITIDTEGGELDILKTIDWSKTTIDVLSVENNYETDTYFSAFLNDKGFIFATKLTIDEVYVHRTFVQEKYTIMFISSWATPQELLKEYSVMIPNHARCWRNLQGTDSTELADICVVMEGSSDKSIYTTIPNKLVCLPREPKAINPRKEYAKFNLPNAYDYDTIYHCVPQFNFLNLDISSLLSIPYPKKSALVSCVLSTKLHTPGAVLRTEFLEKALNAGIPIDVFGRGREHEIKSKSIALLPYSYSLCFENSQQRNYVTEKFTDAIACWTIPIYWGCPNISDYYPKDCYYELDINADDALERLNTILNTPITRQNIIALHHARNLIFSEYNVWSTIRKLVS